MSEPADATASAFTRAGFSAADAASRAALVGEASAGVRALTGHGAHWRWFVPGRLEVFGKHTDYGGGPSLVAAVPRGFAVAAFSRSDTRVRIADVRRRETVELDAASGVSPSGWARYPAAAIGRLASNFPGAELGADIAFASDLPRAAGLSSSSALVVAIAEVLIRRGRLAARGEWIRDVPTAAAHAEYLSCIENGHGYRALEGGAGVGTQGGSEDHAAMLLARAGCLCELAFMPVRATRYVPLPAGWRFVIATSGVHANKTGAVRHRYNRASRALQALAALARHSGAGASSLADALDAHPDAARRLEADVRHRAFADFTPDDLVRRLAHFVNERARVTEAADAFATADAARVGRLARASQQEADTLLGNQVPETTSLAEAALQAGAEAASAFGAGFGGSVWALVTHGNDDDAAFADEWLSVYRRRYPARTAQWFSAVPAPGVLEI